MTIAPSNHRGRRACDAAVAATRLSIRRPSSSPESTHRGDPTQGFGELSFLQGVSGDNSFGTRAASVVALPKSELLGSNGADELFNTPNLRKGKSLRDSRGGEVHCGEAHLKVTLPEGMGVGGAETRFGPDGALSPPRLPPPGGGLASTTTRPAPPVRPPRRHDEEESTSRNHGAPAARVPSPRLRGALDAAAVDVQTGRVCGWLFVGLCGSARVVVSGGWVWVFWCSGLV